MKATEIKAKELVEKFKKARNKEKQYYIIPITDDAIPLAIISQHREVDLLQKLNDSIHSSLLFVYLQEAQEVLTHLKEM